MPLFSKIFSCGFAPHPLALGLSRFLPSLRWLKAFTQLNLVSGDYLSLFPSFAANIYCPSQTSRLEQAEGRAGIVHQGRLIALGTPAELRQKVGLVTVESRMNGEATRYEHFPDRDSATK